MPAGPARSSGGILDRQPLMDWYRRSRARSEALFDLIDDEAYYARPIALRLPIVFYEGYLPIFSFNTLVKRGLGRPSIDTRYETLFARGIDPHESLSALWNAAESRVEVHLVSTREQRVVIPHAQVDVTLKEGERIWTESSYKYEPIEVTRLLSRCGFAARSQWVDNDARFALTPADVE